MFTKSLSLLGATVVFAFLLNSCSKNDLLHDVGENIEAISNENNPFKNLPLLKQPAPGELRKAIDNGFKKDRLNTLNASPCGTIEITKTSSFDEQILLDPLSDIMYLGSVINANSLNDGGYQPVTPITTSNITISLNLLGVQGSVYKVISPQLSTYRQGVNDILNQEITGEQPGELTYSVNQIYSEDQLKLAIGGSFSLGKLADIKASYNFNSNDTKTRIVAKFVQKYYTADMDIPQSGSFVTSLPNSPTVSPVYVSSLTYGRMGLFFMESSASSTQLNAAINTTINFVFGKSSLEASLEQKAILNTSTIKVYTTGGAGSGAVQSISGYEGFVSFIQTGGKFSIDSRGAILAYKLRALSDNTVYSVNLTSTYNIRDCSNVKVPIYSWYASSIGDHVYSSDANAMSQWSGWVNQGVEFKAYSAQVEGSVPIYSWYANSIGDHVYSPDANAMSQWSGWVNQGVAFYAFKSQVDGTVPIYSWYANSISDHVYSKDPNFMYQWSGWVNQGVAFYAFP